MLADEIYDEVAYRYDGSLEGLLSVIFASYQNKEIPRDVHAIESIQPRLFERVTFIETNVEHAKRVARGLSRACGEESLAAICKASLSSNPSAPLAAYRFARYAMDEHRSRNCGRCSAATSCAASGNMRRYCPRLKGHALANIAHPSVEKLFAINRSIANECENVRQFARFEHLRTQGGHIWFARCNPRDAVVPLVMDHFARRFGAEPFALFDEAHGVLGMSDGTTWRIVNNIAEADITSALANAPEEDEMRRAWKRFYQSTSNDARYHPELRVQFIPRRFWGHLTELHDEPTPQKADAAENHPSSPRI